ncbi:MAG: CoA-binding protein [Chloroflexi bacterium]|nr:CoA-binding protein [Chloroflexota bacterium]
MATPTIIIGNEVFVGFAANRAKIEERLRQPLGEAVLPSPAQAGATAWEETDRLAKQILEKSKTIAIVGLSPNPERDSHEVARYLQSQGYRIIPVNPQASEILGERSYASLADVPDPVDVVDIFRRPEHVPPIVEAAIAKGIPAIWMQLGVVNEEAAAQARAAGLQVIMDRCMQVEHRRLLRPPSGQG